MNTANRTRRDVMAQAWNLYRLRALPGSVIRTFSDALCASWRWTKATASRAAAVATWNVGPQRHVRFASMVRSPIARPLNGQAYAGVRAASAGYVTSRIGA